MSENIPIFIINLKRDTERRKHMEQFCKQYDLQCKFRDAVYGNDLTEDIISKIYDKEASINKFGVN